MDDGRAYREEQLLAAARAWHHRAEVAERGLRRVADFTLVHITVADIVRTALNELDELDDPEEPT
jgi:hypothetical protein